MEARRPLGGPAAALSDDPAPPAHGLAEALSQAVLASALDAVVTMDAHGCITGANPAAADMFGWPVDELVGADLADRVIPEPLRDAHRRGLRHFRATGTGPLLGRRIETVALRAGGASFPVELALRVAPGDGPLVVAATLRDVSARRAAEAALEDERRRALALARYTLRAAVAAGVTEPTAMLALLNAAVLEQEPGEWCTAAVGELTTGGRWRLEVACGGHPQPLLVGPGGEVRPIGGRSTVVGWDARTTFRVEAVELEPGAAVVWSTDGVADTRGPGGRFTEDRLRRLLARPWPSAAAAADAVWDITSAWAAADPDAADDTALLVLRRRS